MTTVWSSVMLVKLKTTVGLQSYMASVKPRYYAGKLFSGVHGYACPRVCDKASIILFTHYVFVCIEISMTVYL